ncbi:cbb3-type cytochrome oxidase assembly protein CcoS [Marinicella rhabdoformis]|uniref:cbb3-type cytochrome oxidase assembly protein CcoS n=1 Tax=Marinicella rhabdoformis TaxID=2580566 RepID=UPI0012AEC913|nr:cbb3-type cytochrome oxidase assembly protein CcoS [Marinicella rhabdoformis]
MNMVVILVLLSLVLAGVALWAFFWAINSDQFDDLDSPAMSILKDDPAEDFTEDHVKSIDEKADQNQDGSPPKE